VLAALSAEGRVGCVAGAERRRRAINRELDQRHEFGPVRVVAALASKGAQRHVSNHAVFALDLARHGGVVVVRGPEDERGAQRGVQVGPEGAGEATDLLRFTGRRFTGRRWCQ
jgi:hypothetical protein